MNYAMAATGTVRFPDQTFRLQWEVEDEARPVKHSVLSLLTDTGQRVRRILGRTFGLAQERAVVFSAKAKECERDLNPASISPSSPDYLVPRDDEYVDLVRIPHPVTRTGECEAIYYSPRAALQLRRLADQQRDRRTSEARKAEIRREVDLITVNSSIRVPMQITELSDRAIPKLNLESRPH